MFALDDDNSFFREEERHFYEGLLLSITYGIMFKRVYSFNFSNTLMYLIVSFARVCLSFD